MDETLVKEFNFLYILPTWSLKFGLQSILNLISFLELVFYICAVPVFKFEFFLIYNSTRLVFISLRIIAPQTLK